MYQNGRRLNRHARKRKHIDNLKRRSTPYDFKNYDSYVEYCVMQDALYDALYWWHNNKPVTRAPYYKRYWEAYTGIVSPGWKKNLKNAAHRAERAYWRDQLTQLDEDYDLPNMRRGQRFSDPWSWD